MMKLPIQLSMALKSFAAEDPPILDLLETVPPLLIECQLSARSGSPEWSFLALDCGAARA